MPRFQAGFSDADAAGAVEKAVKELETRRRDFISTISANLVALFKGSVTIRPEFFINGVYGKGPIEFGILYDSDIIIGVTTAKRGDMDQGLAQNLIQLYSTAQTNQSLHGVKKRKADDRGVEKILYGLVTDAEYWCITRLVFTDEETQVSLSDQNAELFCPLFLSDKSALHSGLTELYKQLFHSVPSHNKLNFHMSHSAFLQLRFPNGNCIKRGSIAKALVLLHVSSGPLSGENGLILEFHGNVSAAWEERGKDTTISDEIEDMFADEVVQLPRENPLSLSKAFFTQKIQVLRQSLWHSGNYEYNVEIPIPNDLPFTFTSTWPATHSQSTINASITYSCSVYIPSTSSFISDLKSNTVKLLISPILPTKSIPPTIQRPISSNSSIPVLFSGKININTSLSRGFIVFGERSRPIESSVPFSVTATVQNNSNHTINSININLVEKVSLQAQNNQTNFSTVLSTWNFSGCDPGASLLLENIYVDIPNSGAPSTFIWPDNSTLQTPSHAKCNPITPNVVNSVVSIRHEIQIQCNFPWYLFTKCIASTAIMVVSDAGPTPYFDDSVVIPSTSSSSAFQTPDEELKLDNEEWELIDNETPFDARPIDFGKVYEGSIGFQERRMYLFELSENVRSSSLHHSIGVKLVSDSDAGLRVSKGSLPGWWKYENKEESRIALHGKKDEVHEQEYVCSFNSGYGQYFIAVYGNQFSRETNYKITITGIQRISDADRDRFLVSENWSVVTPGVNSEFAKIPEHAWAVGNDFDGSPYYVARAWVEGGLQIGKIGINMETACISYGGREVFVTDQFEVLCLPSTTLTYQTTILPFEGIRWVEVLGPSSIPTNAIAFGHESDGSQLFLARVSFSSSVPFSNHKTLIPGKAGYHLRGAHVAYAGYEKVIERFECLVYDEPLGYVDTIKQNVKGKRRAF